MTLKAALEEIKKDAEIFSELSHSSDITKLQLKLLRVIEKLIEQRDYYIKQAISRMNERYHDEVQINIDECNEDLSALLTQAAEVK